MDNAVMEEIFKEKNLKIYIDKLMLDINNNTDSLKLTVANYLFLHSSKIMRKLSSFFNEAGIEYKMQELSNIITEEEKKLTDLIDNLIDEKSSDVKKSVSDTEIKEEDISKSIDESTVKFEDKFKTDLNTEIYINFKENLISIYEMHSEENIERLTNILKTSSNDVYSAIFDAVKHRDLTLKNITAESYEKFNSLNEKTIDQNKVKKKESE